MIPDSLEAAGFAIFEDTRSRQERLISHVMKVALLINDRFVIDE